MVSRTSPLSKLAKLTLSLALLVQLAPALRPAPAEAATNPCSNVPGVCRATWDPVSRCCISDPRFDCVDICF